MSLSFRKEFFIAGEEKMLAFGAALARWLPGQGVITLEGDLGAGKTTLVRGLLTELGHTGVVKSPTYTLVEPYHLNGRDIYHFDLYRLGAPDELEYMGFRDYFNENSLCLLEWPEKGGDFVPLPDVSLRISIINEARNIAVYSVESKNINELA
ncbi:MAG: tRNA (adenosine(37)-N6)-threonylcarbamoyltransferase complex ATPase subunit type 1 TsaE [Thiolinea sp.]